MGVWGFWQRPTEPIDKSDYDREADSLDRESEEEFIEREMSYADAMEMGEVWEEITTDEGGWGAWMGGEL